MTVSVSARPAYLVFDYVEASTNAITGVVIRPEFWKVTALVTDEQSAHDWAGSTGQVLETSYTHAMNIHRAERAYTADDMANFFKAVK